MDPDVRRGAIPGIQEWREAGPDAYEAAMKIGIAAVSGTYRGRVTAVDQIPPARYTLRIEGSGGPGFITAEGHVRLTSTFAWAGRTKPSPARRSGRTTMSSSSRTIPRSMSRR